MRVTPRARDNRIGGIAAGRLKIAVTAPAAENRANDAVLRLLAKEWRLPHTTLSIASGARSRDKLVHIAGDPKELMLWLSTLLQPN